MSEISCCMNCEYLMVNVPSQKLILMIIQINVPLGYVTCKDCKYWNKETEYCKHWSEDAYYTVHTGADFYCEDARRK